MKLNDFQLLAARTSKWQPGEAGFQGRDHKLYCAVKLCEEAGEAGAPVTKSAFNGHAEQRGKVAEELGDALWFIAEQARAHGFTLEEIARRNIEKLKRRYPHVYTDADSIARRDEFPDSPTKPSKVVW